MVGNSSSETGEAFNDWRRSTFAPLSIPPFRAIWLASSLSNFGTLIQVTAAAWLMTRLTTSPSLVAFVQTASAVPIILLMILSGAASDLFDKRRQVLAGTVLSIITASWLAFIAWNDTITPIMLLAGTALLAAGGTLIAPAWQASVIDIVERDKLPQAISLNSLSFNLARCVAPGLGAAIVLASGAAAAFAINAVSYIGLFHAVRMWPRVDRHQRLPREGLGRAIGDGLRFALLSPAVRVILLRVLLFGVAASALIATPPLLALRSDNSARALGIILMGFGVGSMAGSLTVAWARERMSPQWLSFVQALAIAAMLLLLALVHSTAVATLAMMISGFAYIQTIAILQVAIQTACPRWVTGRTIALFSTCFALGIAAGSALWGALVEMFDLSVTLAIAAGAVAVNALIGTRIPLPKDEDIDFAPRDSRALDDAPAVDFRSGPVTLLVAYRVSESKMDQFRGAMVEMRRVRRRDGARRWRLSQNVDDPAQWTEHFESPTWGDYLHRVSRRLAADIPVQDSVTECLEGPPEWSRLIERHPSAATGSEDGHWTADRTADLTRL